MLSNSGDFQIKKRLSVYNEAKSKGRTHKHIVVEPGSLHGPVIDQVQVQVFGMSTIGGEPMSSGADLEISPKLVSAFRMQSRGSGSKTNRRPHCNSGATLYRKKGKQF